MEIPFCSKLPVAVAGERAARVYEPRLAPDDVVWYTTASTSRYHSKKGCIREQPFLHDAWTSCTWRELHARYAKIRPCKTCRPHLLPGEAR